jgi:hypothetical protein
MTFQSFIMIYLFSFTFSLVSFSQQPILKESLRKNDSLARYAENLVFRGKTRDADEILSKIKIENSESPEEKLINGKIALDKFDLTLARDLFENLLKHRKIILNYIIIMA